ncbi:hypothetical protein M7I_2605 [Glarea lozoyensis 74030]|uniref:Uncharacterized protein n=1 Tax=Glarea lozoyensis (strain ATCC 74030 / MF5533) TaxID=1104152 RepID=H0EJA3_GLAL7|nr:hypothetical protein M7I_2605 [Glarea lozoyensis 74030]
MSQRDSDTSFYTLDFLEQIGAMAGASRSPCLEQMEKGSKVLKTMLTFKEIENEIGKEKYFASIGRPNHA